MINVDLNTDEVIAQLSECLSDKDAKYAVVNAINKTATDLRKELYNIVRDRYAVKSSGFNKNVITLKRATPSRLYALLNTKGTPTPIMSFKTNKTKPNSGGTDAVKATILKANGQKSLLKNGLKSFVQRMPNGHVGVFVRKGNVKRVNSKSSNSRKTVRYWPIQEMFTLSPPSMLYSSFDGKRQQEIEEVITRQTRENLDNQIQRAIEKARSRQ